MLAKFRQLPRKISHGLQEGVFQLQRRTAEKVLQAIPPLAPPLVSGRVLVDGTWDNPNYWFRFGLLKAALNLNAAEMVGFIGPHRRREQLGSFKRFGIARHHDLLDSRRFQEQNQPLAAQLCAAAAEQRDVLAWQLPQNFPASYLYDYLLKVQRRGTIDLGAESFFEHTLIFLNYLSQADQLLAVEQPSLVVASHNLGLCGPLVWVALQRRIPVIIPFGDNGVLRFWMMTDPAQMYDFVDRPTAADLQRLEPGQQEALAAVGHAAIQRRLTGESTNMGANYAYAMRPTRVEREGIYRRFEWTTPKPIIGVYASNWFDWPHSLGMKHFENFYDWIAATLQVAAAQPDFYWIFKGHPADAWYGGCTIGDLIQVAGLPHIRLAPSDWHGASMLQALDAFVTYHGTVGIEATVLGKPVLVADQGWYDDCRFVRVPDSRQHYLELVRQRWWEDMDQEGNLRLASIFAGCFYGKPAWQNGFLLEDDSEQWKNYRETIGLVKNNHDIIARETALLREWFTLRHPHYHTFKMMRSKEYVP